MADEEEDDDTAEQEPCDECNNPIGEVGRSGLCDDCLENHVAEDFVGTLDDPDDIGQSEYRIIHDHLNECAGQMEEIGKEQLELLDSSLDEIIGWAQSIKAKLAAKIAEDYPEEKK